MSSAIRELNERYPSLPYVIPFFVFIAFLGLTPYLDALGRWEYPLRVVVLAAVLYIFSRDVLDFRVKSPLGSIALGVAVFVIWIGPDVLFPGYREHWLFQNSITGTLKSSIATDLRSDTMVLVIRFLRAAVLVPIVEELFWRAWLMRWIINTDFRQVPIGTYTLQSMAITAALFASEHGPYWEVGLITGILYNWWMIRTRSLGDCILTHGVTNACLSAYVLVTEKWEYWM